jgi:hypothetical protein
MRQQDELNNTHRFRESAASWALSPTKMLTSDTASVTDAEVPEALPVKGADSPDEDIQLSMATEEQSFRRLRAAFSGHHQLPSERPGDVGNTAEVLRSRRHDLIPRGHKRPSRNSGVSIQRLYIQRIHNLQRLRS